MVSMAICEQAAHKFGFSAASFTLWIKGSPQQTQIRELTQADYEPMRIKTQTKLIQKLFTNSLSKQLS
jgi:DNA modification methylase